MSKETVVDIITKAITDAGFCDQLFAAPQAVLAGFDLTEEERTSLTNLKRENLDLFASEVEERVSKSRGPGIFWLGEIEAIHQAVGVSIGDSATITPINLP